MSDSKRARGTRWIAATVTAGLIAFSSGAFDRAAAKGNDDQGVNFHDAVGSWWGRAVPIPGETVCPPGAPGCPIPPELVMVFTINQDGTFIGTDSGMGGGSYTTAHGQWTRSGPKSIQAAFTYLQWSPGGVLIGGFKNRFNATVTDRNEMVGTIDAYLYNYTDTTGRTIDDADGLPTPSPLSPVSECATTPGCTHVGKFSFITRRVFQ